VEECAASVLYLLRAPQEALQLGARGREHVRQHFLMPRLLLEELRLMDALAHEQPLEPRGIVLQSQAGASP
jgi:trehalose synthase